ncbi:hypothetical protein EDD16DRAFT_1558414, partial [Pisolithus croceorrhizus]
RLRQDPLPGCDITGLKDEIMDLVGEVGAIDNDLKMDKLRKEDLLFQRRTSSSVLPLTALATDVYQSLVHRTELPQHCEFHFTWYDYRLTSVHPSRMHGGAYWDAFYVDTPGKLPESPGDIMEVVSTHLRKAPPVYSQTYPRGADVATLHCLKASRRTVCYR